MYNRQDVAFNPLTGELHALCANQSALTVNGVEIPGYADQFFSRIVIDGGGIEWIITSGAGVTVLRNRLPFHQFDGGYGYGFSALFVGLSRVEVYLMGPHDGAGFCTVSVFTTDGEPLHAYQMHYASRGMIDIAPDGTPIPADRGPIQFGDMTLWDWMERDGNYIGNSDGGDTPNGSVGLYKADGTSLMAQLGQSIQLPPRLAVKPGQWAGAASGENVPPPNLMPWEPFHLAGQPPIEPPIDPPPTNYNPKADLMRIQSQLDGVQAELKRTQTELANVIARLP